MEHNTERQMETWAEPTIEQLETLPIGSEVCILQPLPDGSGVSLQSFIWDNESVIIAREHAKVCGDVHILFLIYILPVIEVPDEVPTDLIQKGH
jgi:hypothetical protein